MIAILEARVPTIDLNTKKAIALNKFLLDHKQVANKEVVSSTIYGVAETRIVFGVRVKRLDDAWIIGYPILAEAWRETNDVELRPTRLTVYFHETKWNEPGVPAKDVDNG